MSWIARVLAVAGLIVVGWALATALPAVLHGHPAYAVLLLLTVIGAAWGLWRHRQGRELPTGWRRVGSVALALGALGWLVAVWWCRPFSAQEPALTAMESDQAVTVTETLTRVVLEPTAGAAATAIMFQPGAKVEARAYAAVLRPLVEAGHRVVIIKQPLGIGFLAMGALDAVREEHADATSWVVGGHSLGGTVASLQADAGDEDQAAPVTGLMLYASYPADDISGSLRAAVLSVSGTNDGLATPADIEASRANLPGDATFDVIEGAIHAFFGDYGAQPGDGQPTISHDEARTRISGASMAFLAELTVAAAGT